MYINLNLSMVVVVVRVDVHVKVKPLNWFIICITHRRRRQNEILERFDVVRTIELHLRATLLRFPCLLVLPERPNSSSFEIEASALADCGYAVRYYKSKSLLLLLLLRLMRQSQGVHGQRGRGRSSSR